VRDAGGGRMLVAVSDQRLHIALDVRVAEGPTHSHVSDGVTAGEIVLGMPRVDRGARWNVRLAAPRHPEPNGRIPRQASAEEEGR
jgi:hypothetical protein